MIHLDTNCLIDVHSVRRRSVHGCYQRSARANRYRVLVWAEYLCGPLSSKERDLSWQLIEGSPVPLESFAAELGAQFFNSTGRRRASLADCLIAATAVSNNAKFITLDNRDFFPFKSLGLKLADWRS